MATAWHVVLVDLSLSPVSSLVRLTSPSLSRRWRLINEMYKLQRDVAPCVAALRLNSTPVITYYHPFRRYLYSVCLIVLR